MNLKIFRESIEQVNSRINDIGNYGECGSKADGRRSSSYG
jgi:hypothetical protein